MTTPPPGGRKWSRQATVILALRVRWAVANRRTSNASLIKTCRLRDRHETDAACGQNFSRWLRHADVDEKWRLLHDDELDRVHEEVQRLPPIDFELLITLLPQNHLFDSLEVWLRPPVHGSTRREFQPHYAVYRSSALAPGTIVRGSLTIAPDTDGRILTREHYVLNGYGTRDGTYDATGYIVGGRENLIYMLSRFQNADLQTIVFTKNETHGDGTVILMKGLLLTTMKNEPYAARIYCEVEQEPSAEIPDHVRREFAKPVEHFNAVGLMSL